MKNKDIKQLLDACEETTIIISKQIDDKEGVNKIHLKNTLENMRSALDYLAQDILRKLKSNPTNSMLSSKIYFPSGQRENHFRRSIKKNLAPLKECEPEIYDLIESIQPYNSKDNWLVDLYSLTNNAKHNELSKIEDQEVTVIDQYGFGRFEAGPGSNVTMTNCVANGIILDDIYIKDNDVKIVRRSGSAKISNYNKIKFHGKELEIVPFLTHCRAEIKALVTNIEDIL